MQGEGGGENQKKRPPLSHHCSATRLTCLSATEHQSHHRFIAIQFTTSSATVDARAIRRPLLVRPKPHIDQTLPEWLLMVPSAAVSRWPSAHVAAIWPQAPTGPFFCASVRKVHFLRTFLSCQAQR